MRTEREHWSLSSSAAKATGTAPWHFPYVRLPGDRSPAGYPSLYFAKKIDDVFCRVAIRGVASRCPRLGRSITIEWFCMMRLPFSS